MRAFFTVGDQVAALGLLTQPAQPLRLAQGDVDRMAGGAGRPRRVAGTCCPGCLPVSRPEGMAGPSPPRCAAGMQNEGVLMRLRKMPNVGRTLGQLALGLLALLCVLYALYMAFLMPPLVKYGNSAARADGRVFCAAEGRKAYDAVIKQHPDDLGLAFNPYDSDSAPNKLRVTEIDCLAETSIDTPLLVFRATILLIIGAASALLASRLRVT